MKKTSEIGIGHDIIIDEIAQWPLHVSGGVGRFAKEWRTGELVKPKGEANKSLVDITRLLIT